MNSINLPVYDLIIIIVYIIGILVVGLWVSRRKDKSSETYFLASRGLKWPVIGAALFASNISTIHLIGLAASGYEEGLVWGNFEWLASITLIMLGLIFAPIYFRTRIATLPEFMEKRYGKNSRTVLAFIGIIAALFVHIGMSLYSGAVVFESFFGINVIYSIVLISAITTLYTVLGGLKAVVVTESIQTVILLCGTFLLTCFAIYALPEHGIHSLADLKSSLKPGQLKMLHTNGSIDALSERRISSGLTWYACILGYPVLGIWYWCSDQTHVQRVLGAETLTDAQQGPIFAGFLKLLPVFLLITPGLIGYAIFRDEIGTNANQTFPFLVNKLLPTGIKGIVAAALLAALMSNIAAALNSIGTLVAIDIVQRAKPKSTDAQLIKAGRIAAVVVMILAMLWSTQGSNFTSIFEAINKIAAALAPPISVVLLFGVFSHRGTGSAAIITLIIGFIIGASLFCLDYPPISGRMIITQDYGTPFMLQACWLFILCTVVYWVVSFLTPVPDRSQINELVWETPTTFLQGKIDSWSNPRLAALYLLIVLAIFYTIFG
jgi:solute:Na+ symporter, SSS family